MQDLKVIGVDDGALLAADDGGERYRIEIDEVLLSRLRRSRSEAPQTGPKVPPREIQAHIRTGLSAAEVSDMTGCDLDYVQRFEGPIIAEREHVVNTALAVAVHSADEIDPLAEDSVTFGATIRERLASLGATGEQWVAWKEPEGGWILKLTFTADEIDHDARWAFDARKRSLSALNSEATTLSQQGELEGGLTPRLRAVTALTPDRSRFDSGAFKPLETEARPPREGSADAARRNPDTAPAHNETADLLEALRRRRGEREAADYTPEEPHHETGVVDVPLEPFQPEEGENSPAPARQSRRGRAAMPSWDEIVFGARGDDDPA